MRVRSYEYYEVVSDLTGKNYNVHYWGSEAYCRNHMMKMSETVDSNGNLYLVRCQLIEAFKADKS